MANIQQIVNDPEFLSMQPEEQRKVLAAVDSDFAGMDTENQRRAVFGLTGTRNAAPSAAAALNAELRRPATLQPGNVLSEYDVNKPGLQQAIETAHAPRIPQAIPTYQAKDSVQAYQMADLGERDGLREAQDNMAVAPKADPAPERPSLLRRGMEAVGSTVANAVASTGKLGMAVLQPTGLVGDEEENASIYADTNKALDQNRQDAGIPQAEGVLEHATDIAGGLAPYLIAGPMALPSMIASAMTSRGEQSLDQGDSTGTAVAKSAIGGVGAYALGHMLPGGVKGVVSSPAVGIAERGAINLLTDDPAHKEKVFDPAAMATDVATFGVLHAAALPAQIRFNRAAKNFVDAFTDAGFGSGAFQTKQEAASAAQNFVTSMMQKSQEAAKAKKDSRFMQPGEAKTKAGEVQPEEFVRALDESAAMLREKGAQFDAAALRKMTEMAKGPVVDAEGTVAAGPVDLIAGPAAPKVNTEVPARGIDPIEASQGQRSEPAATPAPAAFTPTAQPGAPTATDGGTNPVPAAPAVSRQDFMDQHGTPDPTVKSDLDAGAHQAATSPISAINAPTSGQIEAGTYPKGSVKLHGMDISIENPEGSVRESKPGSAVPWRTKMADHYGYIKGTVGNDKDHLDVFIKPGTPQSYQGKTAHVIDQIDPATGKFDEHKIMLGYGDEDAARAAYLRNYDHTGPDRIGALTATPVEHLKEWLKNGDTTQEYRRRGITGNIKKLGEQEAFVRKHLPDANLTPFEDARQATDNLEAHGKAVKGSAPSAEEHNRRSELRNQWATALDQVEELVKQARVAAAPPAKADTPAAMPRTAKATEKSPQAWTQTAKVDGDFIYVSGKLRTRPHELYPDTPDHSYQIHVSKWDAAEKAPNPAAAKRKLVMENSPLDNMEASHDRIKDAQVKAIDAAMKQTKQAANLEEVKTKANGGASTETNTEKGIDNGKAENGQGRPERAEAGQKAEQGGRESGEVQTGQKDGLLTPHGEYYKKALSLLESEGEISSAKIQRHMGLGYNAAARVMEQLRENGVIDASGQPLEDVSAADVPAPAEEDEFDKAWAEAERRVEAEKAAAKGAPKAPKSAPKERQEAPEEKAKRQQANREKVKTKRTAKEAGDSAKANAKKVFDEGVDALKKIMEAAAKAKGLGSNLGNVFNAELYAEMRPILKRMWEAAKEGAADSSEALIGFAQDVIKAMGSDFKPYARKFHEEAKSGALQERAETDTVPEEVNTQKSEVKPDGNARKNNSDAVQGDEPGGAGDVPVSAGGRTADPAGRDGVQRGDQHAPGSERGLGGDDGAPAGDSERQVAQDVTENYVIHDPDMLGTGGPKTKTANNIEAIRIVKDLLETGRLATPAERDALAQYVGWGGIPQVFDEANEKWAKERGQLEDLLTLDEFAEARNSTQNAHYTSPAVIKAMYDAVQQMGFQRGIILEPSTGVGNFFGLMPESLKPGSSLFGAEKDIITANIAKSLYPGATIANAPFEDVAYKDDHFDLVIGNPPFGSLKITDVKEKDLSGLSIHNYFYAKTIKKLRPGGLHAMVVSSALMDGALNRDNRVNFAKNVELVGAIRLPNTAFKQNAGTEVTTDIIFLRKLAPGDVPETAWTETVPVAGVDGNAYRVNEYFAKHPEMMLGKPITNKLNDKAGAVFEGGVYKGVPGLQAHEGADIKAALGEAVSKLPSNIYAPVNRTAEMMDADKVIPKPGEAKVWGFLVRGGKIHQRLPDENGRQVAVPYKLPATKTYPEGREPNPTEFARITGMLAINDAYRRLRRSELVDDPAAKIELHRKSLNAAYDQFVSKHGNLSDPVNKRLMRGDINEFPNIMALEKAYDKGVTPSYAKKNGMEARKATAEKADVFRTRQNYPYRQVEKADSAYDALIVSMAETGGMDFGRMEELTGKPYKELIKELGELVFKDPELGNVVSDEYLSGNVRKKLAKAKAMLDKTGDQSWQRNIDALEKVQPKDIDHFGDDGITLHLGAHWIDGKIYSDFVEHLVGAKGAMVKYSEAAGKFITDIDKLHAGVNRIANTETYGTAYMPATIMLPRLMDGRDIVVKVDGPDDTKIVDPQETTAANVKANEIRAAFVNFIADHPVHSETVIRAYNDTVNTDVERKWDGSHLITPGKVDDKIIGLYPHQKNAVWRMIQKGKGLIDHSVGAGKTFTLIAAALEMRRMGLAKKPMVVVPNHLVGQWATDFKRLYPNANVLMIGRKDFSASNRRQFIAKIATGDYDAVVIAHSSFGFIPSPKEFEQRMLQERLAEIVDAIKAAREEAGEPENGKKPKDPTVKELEAIKTRFLQRMKKLQDRPVDDVADFDQLGVDALFVDESHEYRTLQYTTRMGRVKGLGQTAGNKKTEDMYVKTQYLLDRNGDRGVFFATGTPISNTMAELYTIQRYLASKDMKARGISTFDAWANTFGKAVADWELDAGGRLKSVTRFKQFVNAGQLATMYRDFADVVTLPMLKQMAEDRGSRWPVPKIKGLKPTNIVVERSPEQADFMNWIVNRLETLDPRTPKEDNHLYCEGHARLAGLDLRTLVPDATDFEYSKVNRSVAEIVRIYNEWDSRKGTQLVFCDLSTPKKHKGKALEAAKGKLESQDAPEVATKMASDNNDDEAEDTVEVSADELLADALSTTDFSVYDDIKAKLIAKGIPEDQIAFIHDYNTDDQKAELYEKMNQGRMRVLIGSTSKMGAGMNVQARLVGLHHLDAPYMPKDLEQREGRIIRQGNLFYKADPENFEVEIMRYATKNMYDARMWEINEGKAGFTEQFRTAALKGGVVDDVVPESVNAAAMKAEASGNPLIRKEIELRQEINKLEALEANHQRSKRNLRFAIEAGKQADESRASKLAVIAEDEARKAEHPFKAGDPEWTIRLGGRPAFKAKLEDVPTDGEDEAKKAAEKANLEAISANKKAAGDAAAEDFVAFVKSGVAAGGKVEKHFGAYRGFAIMAEYHQGWGTPYITFSIRRPTDKVTLAETTPYQPTDEGNYKFSPSGFFDRLDNLMDKIGGEVPRKMVEDSYQQAKESAKAAEAKANEPSPYAADLRTARDSHNDVVQELSSKGTDVDARLPVEQAERWNWVLDEQRRKREVRERAAEEKEARKGGPLSNQRGTSPELTAVAKAGAEWVQGSAKPVVAGAKAAAAELAHIAVEIKRGMAPTVGNKDAKAFAMQMNKVYGELGRKLDIIVKAAETRHKLFEKMDHDAKMEFMAALHNGHPVAPELQADADFINAVNTTLMNDLHAVAPDILPNVRENYMTAIFKPGKNKEQVIAGIVGKRPWEGSKNWTKHRKWDDVRDAEAAGLELVSDNPYDLMALHVADVQRTIGCRKVYKMTLANGDTIFVSSRHKLPVGYAEIEDRSAQVWRNSIPAWKVQELVAKKTLNPLRLEEFGRGMFEDEDIKDELDALTWDTPNGELNIHAMKNGTGKSYTQLVMENLVKDQQSFANVAPNLYAKIADLADTIKEVETAMKMPKFEDEKVKLPVDGRIFVGRYVMKEPLANVVNNYVSKSLYNMKFGAPFRWLRSAGNTLNAFQLAGFFHANFVMRDMIHNRVGMALDDIYRAAVGHGSWAEVGESIGKVPLAPVETLMKGKDWIKVWNTPGSPGEAAELIVQQLAGAWATPHMDNQFRTNSAQKAIKALREKNLPGAMLRAPLAAVEGTQSWLMDHMVPMAKTGAKGMLIERHMEQHPDATEEELLVFSNEVGNIIDASMGQVNYSRLHMRKSWLNAIQLLIRSPGWTGGTWYLFSKTLPDTYKFLKEWKTNGKAPQHLPLSVRQCVGVLLTHVLINAILTMLYEDGSLIERAMKVKGKDLVFYRTDNLDEKGRPERFASADYIKDLVAMAAAPIQTVSHKVHPLVSMGIDLYKNSDYRGTELIHKGDEAADQVAQMAKVVAGYFLPFFVRNIQVEMDRSSTFEKKAFPLIGETPAPNHAVDTPFESYAHEQMQNQGARVRTQQEVNRQKLRTQIANEIKRDGDSPTFDKALEDGKLTKQDLKSISQKTKSTPTLNALNGLQDMHQLAEGWDKASAAEREELAMPMLKRAQKLMMSTPPADRDKIIKNYERLTDSIERHFNK